MNDSTMPPPKTMPLVSSAAGTKIESDTTSETVAKKTAPRRKGFGLADWNQLLKVSKDLAQLKGQSPHSRKLSWKEIQQHNTIYDGWIVLRGKVYFLSPYLAYHPGGQSVLLKVLGKDATQLYDRYHPWVNEENLIGKLWIGVLDTSARALAGVNQHGFPVPIPRPPKQISSVLEREENEDEGDDEVSFEM